jgi:adenylate kinase family enzyme
LENFSIEDFLGMERILIIGPAGAGKSTLAKRLRAVLDLPIISLDQYFWKPNWKKTSDSEWRNIVVEMVQKDRWIMDGNYRSTLDIRIPRADTIIFLDFPRFICLGRVLKRRFENEQKQCAAGCRERISWNFLKWILWKFPQSGRKYLLEKLKEVENEKSVLIFKSNREVENFLRNLEKTAC